MPTHVLPITILLVLVVAPMAYAVLGRARMRNQRTPVVRPLPAWTWRLSLASMLLYVLAFNLVFFVQELFLVLPKALVPGLRPTLFHNNHSWTGTHPLAELFQGTGVLATLLLGIACGWWLRRENTGAAWWRLLLFWLAFGGVFMALPQLATGALLPQGDAGRAMAYLGMGEGARTLVALLALVAIPLAALWLLKPLLELAGDPAQVADAGARHRYVFLAATLPALLAIGLIVPFRVPREWIEVLIVPVVVTVVGLVWLQAGAWSASRLVVRDGAQAWPVASLLAAALVLLALFQLVLRPGIAFS
jgi:hypothetical protein